MPARTDIREPDLEDFDGLDGLDDLGGSGGGFPEPARTLKFRGPSYDEAVQAAEDALGTRPRVLAAHRIQRGGIGGFFATDLGVEVEVEVPGEDVDETLDRLVESDGGSDTADDDRAAWIRELARAAGLDLDAFVDAPSGADSDAGEAPTGPIADTEAVGSVEPRPSRFGYSEYLSELDLGGVADETAPDDSGADPAPVGSAPSELEPAAGQLELGLDVAATEPAPARPTRPSRRPATAVAGAAPTTAAVPASRPSPARAAAPARPRPSRPAHRIAVPARPATASRPGDEVPVDEQCVDEQWADEQCADEAPGDEQPVDAVPGRRASVPTRHHVDLAVVATSELVRLSGGFEPGTTVDIQVTVTSNDGRSVTAEASVERPAKPGRRRPEARR